MKIAVTGGGTGGHVFPALAVLDELLAEQKGGAAHECVWIGSKTGMERDIVEGRGIRYIAVPSGKLRRYITLKTFVKTIADSFRVLGGCWASYRALRREKPDVLFSKGGYVSVPPVWAASFLGIPVISHESDLDLGLASKLNLGRSEIVCVAYPEVKIKHPRVVVSGNPLRADIFGGDAARAHEMVGLRRQGVGSQSSSTALADSGVAVANYCEQGAGIQSSRELTEQKNKKIILVLGGSQGAEEINGLIKKALPRLKELGYFVIHQYGNGQSEHLISDEEGAGAYYGAPFFKEEMADLYAAADVAISRAGAGSLWELSVHQIPTLLVPLGMRYSRGDQVRNARYFAEHGCHLELSDDETAEEARVAELVEKIERLAGDEALRQDMQKKLGDLCKADAAAKIADMLVELGSAPRA